MVEDEDSFHIPVDENKQKNCAKFHSSWKNILVIRPCARDPLINPNDTPSTQVL